MKLQADTNLSTLINLNDVTRLVTLALRELKKAVNGKLEFGVNIQGVRVTVTFAAANVQQGVTHNLGYTPTSYVVVNSANNGTTAATVYNGTTSANSEIIYLCSTVKGTMTLFIF